MINLSDVLFHDLRSSRKNLNRLLSGGIIFVLLGHFYILYPYFYYKAAERQANVALEGLRADRDRLEGQLSKIREASKEANGALDDIKDRVDGYPEHLRGVLPEIERVLRAAETPQMAIQEPARPSVRGFSLPEDVTEFNQAVRWYIGSWFEKLTKDIRTQVVDPLLRLKELEFRVELEDLHTMADQGMAGIHSYLDGLDPDFWRSYSAGKVPMAEGLEQEITEAFDPILVEVAKLLEKVEGDKERQEEEFGQVEKSVKDIQEDWNKFESRLASLDSPFGRLPLGITDLIMLFPLLIVILTVMVAASIHKSSRLYLSLWTELSNKEKGSDAALLKNYADCWYLPPYRNLLEPTALAAAFAILLGVFLHAALLVSGEKTLFTSLTGQTEVFRRAFFLVAYAVGAVVMLSLTAIVGRTLYRTSRRP